MQTGGKVNILLVDDQPAKLLSYQVILDELQENLLQAHSATEALQILLKTDVAVLLVDVCMPDLDGFELASMVRQHPRFKETAIIFISAIHLSDSDTVRGYEMGAVDYVSVPVIPSVLRAKVRVFVDLYRKTCALEEMNRDLERRVVERTTQLEAAIEQQVLLAQEVDHRAKNAFATIQSVVSLSRSDSPKELTEAIHGRIQAMARAHSLLSQSRWEGANLLGLISEELAPYAEGERVQLDGPPVMLAPNTAQVLAITIHELATNAAKYGALSVTRGLLNIDWTLDERGLSLGWLETNGPLVSAPSRSGFGTNVINSTIRMQLQGDVKFDWLPEGLRCELALPREHVIRGPDAAPPRAPAEMPSEMATNRLEGYRVLLVEDEPLVGLMMSELLATFGLEVVGPVGTLEKALDAAQGQFDIAILDVNLGGQLVYPVADLLAARHVPLVMITGYETSSIKADYARSVILQKPVDSDQLQRHIRKLIPGEAAAPDRAQRHSVGRVGQTAVGMKI